MINIILGLLILISLILSFELGRRIYKLVSDKPKVEYQTTPWYVSKRIFPKVERGMRLLIYDYASHCHVVNVLSVHDDYAEVEDVEKKSFNAKKWIYVPETIILGVMKKRTRKAKDAAKPVSPKDIKDQI